MFWQAPVASQLSIVHALESSQSTGTPAQISALHASPTVHGSPSSHSAPFRGVAVHWPVNGSQAPAVQGPASPEQVITVVGSNMHCPAMQVDLPLQRSPSSKTRQSASDSQLQAPGFPEQTPAVHLSLVVHGSSSVQVVPSGSGNVVQAPEFGSQPDTSQGDTWLLGQVDTVAGSGLQSPPKHLSCPAHRLPSSH